jgi:hypothetical protein
VAFFLAFFKAIIALYGGNVAEEGPGGLLTGLKSWRDVPWRYFFLNIFSAFYCQLYYVILMSLVRLMTSSSLFLLLSSLLSPLLSKLSLGRFWLAFFFFS